MRSKPVKAALVRMIEERFPEFSFAYEWQGICGFVRRNEGRLYDYLLISRNFEEHCQAGWQGYLEIAPPGRGYNPDWYAWSLRDPWRRTAWQKAGCEAVLYQQDKTAFLDEALEKLSKNIEEEILPIYEKIFPDPLPSELRHWQGLAERLLPELEALAQADPERWEALRKWQRTAARSRAARSDPPEEMGRWRETARGLPGFRELWDQSPITQEQVFNWFTHAMGLHP